MRFDWCKTNLHPTCYDYTQDHCEGCNMMRAYLRGYETAQEKVSKSSEWISVSEKLPEDSGNYLITVADLQLGHIGEHTITMADFYEKEKEWNSVVKVLAWMPLPEPYREDGE